MPTPEAKAFAKNLLDFVDSSPTPFQLVSVVSKRLQEAGFEELKEIDSWAGKIKKNGKVLRHLLTSAEWVMKNRC